MLDNCVFTESALVNIFESIIELSWFEGATLFINTFGIIFWIIVIIIMIIWNFIL